MPPVTKRSPCAVTPSVIARAGPARQAQNPSATMRGNCFTRVIASSIEDLQGRHRSAGACSSRAHAIPLAPVLATRAWTWIRLVIRAASAAAPVQETTMKRKASAHWQGSTQEGSGTLSAQSGTLKDTPYSFKARFGDGKGTNPEELIAAAHAGCYTMALSFVMNNAGFTADIIDTEAVLTMDQVDGNPTITAVHLTTRARV